MFKPKLSRWRPGALVEFDSSLTLPEPALSRDPVHLHTPTSPCSQLRTPSSRSRQPSERAPPVSKAVSSERALHRHSSGGGRCTCLSVLLGRVNPTIIILLLIKPFYLMSQTFTYQRMAEFSAPTMPRSTAGRRARGSSGEACAQTTSCPTSPRFPI